MCEEVALCQLASPLYRRQREWCWTAHRELALPAARVRQVHERPSAVFCGLVRLHICLHVPAGDGAVYPCGRSLFGSRRRQRELAAHARQLHVSS
jgi:hypothetical protein